MKFSEIIGQEKAKSILLKAVKAQRIPHALLFSGIPGTGKKSTAKALAMLLNCHSPSEDGGCGSCRPCRQLLNGNSPDFISIVPEKKEGRRSPRVLIEHIREIHKRTSFSPLGRYRVIVIDQADSMTDEAANSFLKLLEEPPEKNIFILNAVEPLNLLPTIISRCQRIQFHPIPSSDIAEWLVKNKRLDPDTALVLSKICGGSLGMAMSLIEKGFLKKREEWLSFLIKLPSMDKDKVLSAAERYLESKDDISNMLMAWQSWLRDMIVVKEAHEKELLINRDLSHMAERISDRYSVKELINGLMLIHKAEHDIYRNRNMSLIIKNTLLGLWKLGAQKGLS